MAKTEIESRIKEVKVESCCGTYCIFMYTTTGERVKIAYVDMSANDAKIVATEYAHLVEKFLTFDGTNKK